MRRHELTGFVWEFIEPLLPNKPRGVPRANDRRVINSIPWRFNQRKRAVSRKSHVIETYIEDQRSMDVTLYGLSSLEQAPPRQRRNCLGLLVRRFCPGRGCLVPKGSQDGCRSDVQLLVNSF